MSLAISWSYSWGGQVVTEESKEWAISAVKQEKALETLRGENTLAHT